MYKAGMHIKLKPGAVPNTDLETGAPVVPCDPEETPPPRKRKRVIRVDDGYIDRICNENTRVLSKSGDYKFRSYGLKLWL